MAIKHFSHEHLLVLNEGIENKDDDNNSGGEEVFCDACWKPIIKEGGSAYYSCSETDPCEFFLHKPCVYYGHKHLLVLNEGIQKRNDNCNACRRPIIKEGDSAYYSCSESDPCDFVLHKTCAELPKEIKHPMHPKHSLALFAVPPYEREEFICNICRSSSRGFTYHCSVCEFDVDVKCAIEDCSFRHQSHDHNLSLLQRPATFHCDACDNIAEDLSYHCTVCPFWIHKECASSPTTIQPTFHNHPLTLSYSIPDKYQMCHICKERVSPNHWLYMCAGCSIFTHIKCATSEPTALSDDEIFVRSLSPEEAADRIEAVRDELYHWSHEDHPLILFENQQLQSERMLICDGCVKSINAEEDPYYACLQCNLFLHKLCATLPREFHHNPFEYEQPLQLLKPRYDFDFKRCGNCRMATNGFYLSGVEFYDVICAAALPNSIKHEAHGHPLVQNMGNKFRPSRCASCSLRIDDIQYSCRERYCNFHIHLGCILLPRTIRHGWDPHPIPLVYPPIPDHPDLFYCEICEEEIDTTYWLYFCGDCDQAFHIDCLRPVYEYSNVKFGSTDHKFECHPHGLTFVRKSENWYPSPCGECGKSRDGEPVLECAPCNFLLCPRPCAIDLLSIDEGLVG